MGDLREEDGSGTKTALSLSLSISPTALKRKENWATKDNRRRRRRRRAQRVITTPPTDERDYPHYPSDHRASEVVPFQTKGLSRRFNHFCIH